MSSIRTRLAAILAAGAVLAIAAAPAAAVGNNAMVRVLHASPDAPAVDVYVNDVKVGAPLANLAFGDLSTYVALPAGTYNIKVCAAADATVCPIIANGVALTAGTHYTIAATNVLASIEAQVITDAPAPVADKTQVRVVHFSADTPAVDVLTQDGSATVVSDLSYPNATGYLSLAPGSYDLKVCAHADTTVCPLDPGALSLDAGRSYSVFAIGSLSGSTLTAVVGVDAVAAPATDVAPGVNPGTQAAGIALAIAGVLSLLVGVRLATRPAAR
jgi:hypothetical protein